MCTVTIDSVGGIGPGPSSISVLGTIEDCEVFEGGSVRVRLACGSEDNVIGEQTVTPDATGAWQASFDNNPDGDCRCDGDVFVTATCVSDPTCSTSVAQPLACIECPVIEPPDDDAGTPTIVVECNPDGTADVTITQKVTNVTSSAKNVQMECGPDGTHIAGGFMLVLAGQTNLMSMTCRYPTPHAPLPVRVTVFTGTPPFELLACPPLEIPLPPLQPCEAQCPQILNVAVDIRGCTLDDDGIEKRRVVFTPTVSTTPANYFWVFGDGSPLVWGMDDPTTIDHFYEAKPVFPPQLCLIGPGDCPQVCYQIPLSEFDAFEACACPVIMDIDVQIGDCVVDDDGITKREVTFIPTVSQPWPTSHVWTFGNGDPPESGGMGDPGSKTHLYAAAPTTAPQLCIDGPVPCGQRCASVPLTEFAGFEPCDGSTGEDDDEPESTACLVSRWAILLALAASMFFLLVYQCVPPPIDLWAQLAVGFAALALFLFVGWLLFCATACSGMILAWQTSHVTGLIAAYFSTCCSWALGLGLGLIAASAGLFAAWVARCEPSRCTILRELVAVYGVALAAIFDALGLVPVPCGSVVVKVIVGFLGVVYTAILLATCSSSPQEVMPVTEVLTSRRRRRRRRK